MLNLTEPAPILPFQGLQKDSAVTRNGMTDPCESQLPILPGRPYSVPAEPTFSKASHSPVQAKAWKSSTAAWKRVLGPLRWVIPLRLNCCLNSGSHKLCYSGFIKKQNWWTICLTHYMAETIFQRNGQKPRYHMPWRQDDPSRHGRGQAPMERGAKLWGGDQVRHSNFPCKVGLQRRKEEDDLALDMHSHTEIRRGI